MEITLNINKGEVYDEVVQTTEYTGKKLEQEGSYERVSATEDDRRQLERFWNEARSAVTSALKRVLIDEACEGDEYRLHLDVSVAFDVALLPTMEESLKSYFVLAVTGKWFVLANKGEAAEYASGAAAMLDDVRRKAFFKKKPMRPRYD